MEAFRRVPEAPGSSTWSRCWQDANGWPGPSPSPTSSWRMCCAWSIGSTGWRNYPACRDYVARATARPAFVKATQTRWRILRRRRVMRVRPSRNPPTPASQEDGYTSPTHSTRCRQWLQAVAIYTNPTARQALGNHAVKIGPAIARKVRSGSNDIRRRYAWRTRPVR